MWYISDKSWGTSVAEWAKRSYMARIESKACGSYSESARWISLCAEKQYPGYCTEN